jgi:hypothetical protein
MTRDPIADDLTCMCTRPHAGPGEAPIQGPPMPAARAGYLPDEGFPAGGSPSMLARRGALYASKTPEGLTRIQKRKLGQAFFI